MRHLPTLLDKVSYRGGQCSVFAVDCGLLVRKPFPCDRGRVDKLIEKAGSVVGSDLETVQQVAMRRMLSNQL